MEDNEAAPKIFTPNETNKHYSLYLNNIEYNLTISYTETIISFRVTKNSPVIRYFYLNKFKLEQIRKKLLLLESKFPTIEKVVEIYDHYLEKGKISLIEEEDEKLMILRLKKILDDEEIECDLELNQTSLSSKEIINRLCDEVERVKSRHGSIVEDPDLKNRLNEVINKTKIEIKNQNEEIEKKHNSIFENLRRDFLNGIKELREENKKNIEKLKEEMKNKYENEIKDLKDEIKKISEEINEQNEILNKINQNDETK